MRAARASAVGNNRFEEADIRFEIEENLPPVLADPVRLRQVFENLVTNALKYGCTNPNPVIKVGGNRTGSEVSYYVKDEGDGIEPAYHQKIFGLFQRLSTGAEGTGVGLAIVARIMEVHGGKVWVESAAGQGATFWISLPAGSPPSADDPPSGRHSPALSGGPS